MTRGEAILQSPEFSLSRKDGSIQELQDKVQVKKAKLCACVWDALQSLISRNLWCWNKKAPSHSWATGEFIFPLSTCEDILRCNYVYRPRVMYFIGSLTCCRVFRLLYSNASLMSMPGLAFRRIQGEMEECKRLVQEIMQLCSDECQSNSLLFWEILIRSVVYFPHLPWKQAILLLLMFYWLWCQSLYTFSLALHQ